MCHEQVKNPLHQQNHWWSVFFYLFSNGFFYPSMNGRSWTGLFGPSMNKIVCQEPLFSRSWTALWHCSATCVHSPLMNTPKFAGGLSPSATGGECTVLFLFVCSFIGLFVGSYIVSFVGWFVHPPANLGVFINGEWTHVAEQFHRAVHERLKRSSWQTILFMEGPKRHVHERAFIEG